MLNILITGGLGQLGRALIEVSDSSPNRYIALSSSDLDITNKTSVEEQIVRHSADVVINCAAYTDVERAEDEPTEAMRINRDGVATLAEACQRRNIKLIHISTDYVFGGDNSRRSPYTTTDSTAPINSYGHSKAEGERAAIAANGIVIRTSWLYAPWGKNFCRTILRIAKENTQISVVDDQRGTPTSVLSLARAITHLVDSGIYTNLSGILHYTDGGECTWREFAEEIVRLANIECEIKPCTSDERHTKAERPQYSVLDKSATEKIEGIAITPWQEALKECIEQINNR